MWIVNVLIIMMIAMIHSSPIMVEVMHMRLLVLMITVAKPDAA